MLWTRSNESSKKKKHECRKVDNQRIIQECLTFENMISNNVGYEVIMEI